MSIELFKNEINTSAIDQKLKAKILCLIEAYEYQKEALMDLTSIRMHLCQIPEEIYEELIPEDLKHHHNSDYANERYTHSVDSSNIFEKLINETSVKQVKDDSNLQAALDVYESAEFAGIKIIGSGRFDTSDKNDFVCVFDYEVSDPDEDDQDSNDMLKGSFHVNFDESGKLTDAYAYDVRTGNDMGCVIPKGFIEKALDDETLSAVKETLANDEESIDSEIIKHFVDNLGLSFRQSVAWVAKRDSYIADLLGHGDTPEQSYAI